MARSVRIATRGSALARWQAERVATLLRDRGDVDDVELVIVETAGDRNRDVSIASLGGQGAFVKDVQMAVLGGRADLAVHSAKDLPASTPVEGLVLASVPERADPRDVLVGSTLDALPTGAVVATGAARRRAQLAWVRPDLTFAELRGNVDTRLAKASDFGAVVLAAAGLARLGRLDEATEILEPSVVVPQVAQGALGIECRADDAETRERLAAIEDGGARRCVDAERAFLAELGGGCDLPVGAYAQGDAELTIVGMLAAPDGGVVIRATRQGAEPGALGRSLARHLLDECGGGALLTDLRAGASGP